MDMLLDSNENAEKVSEIELGNHTHIFKTHQSDSSSKFPHIDITLRHFLRLE